MSAAAESSQWDRQDPKDAKRAEGERIAQQLLAMRQEDPAGYEAIVHRLIDRIELRQAHKILDEFKLELERLRALQTREETELARQFGTLSSS